MRVLKLVNGCWDVESRAYAVYSYDLASEIT
jgi:hypothetical protein